MLRSWKIRSVVLLIAMLVSFIPVLPAAAADLLIPNYSFESGVTSWTQAYGTGGITASTDQAFTGTKSLKLVDGSTTLQYGMESDYKTAAAGQDYVAMSRVYVASGSANLYIRFYNSSHTLLTSAFAGKSSPVNQWTTIKVKAAAPANTAYVTAMLYSNASNTGTTYWDDVALTPEFLNLGVQVTNSVPHAATFGIGTDASNLYAVMDGAAGTVDAKLSKINLNSETVTASYALSGAGGGWAATTGTDGTIYAGTFSLGHLYSYAPGGTSATDLGQALAGSTHIRGLTAGLAGKIYGGTYLDAGFFRYYAGSTGGGFLQIG